MLVDVSSADVYARAHLAGARWVDYARLNLGSAPAPGTIPALAQLATVLDQLGLNSDKNAPHVVAYDGDGGGRSARFLWTLDLLNYPHWSWLDGGLTAWLNAGGDIQSTATGAPAPETGADANRSSWEINEAVRADRDYILSTLDQNDVTVVDCRSAAEYRGADVRAARGGHIPGAIHSDWMDTISLENGPALRDATTLRKQFLDCGVSPDSEIILYCQTHHRSSHAYVVLKALGYQSLRGYDGSWSDWGNASDTPVSSETSPTAT